jgi:hypothetical protein
MEIRIRPKIKCKNCDHMIWKYVSKQGLCQSCSHKGKPRSESTKEKIRTSQSGEKSHAWKGDEVGYAALHTWVKKVFPKTKLCQCCGKVPPKDLANKGIYNREVKNWEWLCRRCHMTKDGRFKNLKQNREDTK